MFEFGAVLYLTEIYPHTLLPLSIYAFARGAAAILFSPAVGNYIDTKDRLHVVRLSIGNFASSKRTMLSVANLVFVFSWSESGRGGFLRDVLAPC